MTLRSQQRSAIALWLTPIEGGWRDVGIALAIAAAYLCLLLGSVDDLGYARDEGFYFHAASVYQRWLELLWQDPGAAFARVDEHWRINAEHPALIKSAFALSHALLWDRWRLFDMEGTSYRFAGMAFSVIGVGLCYLWGARVRGRLAGAVAAVALAAMPRFFYHAHLACFDAPVVSMWMLCAYAWWRSLALGGTARHLAVGLCFALALNTKHNAWFLPIVCGVHAVACMFPGASSGIARNVLRQRALASLAAMALVGPALFYASWPWIWHDTLPRLTAYARFHLEHVYYNMEFLGDTYWQPPMPRAYAFVMTLATVPTVTLLCFAVGVCALARRDLWPWWRGRARSQARVDPATTLLWFAAIAVQYAAWLRPTTPIFGGTKHWMTAYPFVALCAGCGVAALVQHARLRWLRDGALVRLLRWPLEPAFALCCLLPAIVQTAHAHPWALSSYVPLFGGAAGGANLGLNRGFWGYQTGAVAAVIDAEAPRRGRVYLHDTARQAWDMLQRDGRVRADLRGVLAAGDADLGLYHHEQHMGGVEYQLWLVFGTTAPRHIAGLDGVPVIWIYGPRGAAPDR